MEEYKKKISDEEFLEALWDPEWDRQMIINTERKIGREEGREEGRQEGLEEGRMEGLEEGREEGHQEGQNEKAKEIAKSMLEKDMEISLITELTGLTKEEIEMLKR